MPDPRQSPRPYTGTLFFVTFGFAIIWLVRDMREGGQHIVSAAYGVRSNVWLTVWLVVTLFLLLRFGTVAAGLFRSFSGRPVGQADDEFVMSGGPDVSLWSLLGGLAGAIVLFARWVPPSWFGWFRPVLVPFVAVLSSLVVSTVVLSRLYRVLYPRVPQWR